MTEYMTRTLPVDEKPDKMLNHEAEHGWELKGFIVLTTVFPKKLVRYIFERKNNPTEIRIDWRNTHINSD